nr:hypothetical protein [Pedobacter puniceum]
MKANHNGKFLNNKLDVVVVNISSSKNESKSQRGLVLEEVQAGCCKYQ